MNQQRHDFRVLLLELVGLLSVMAIALINISHAATINVDSSSDALQNDDNCTLREAVQAANTDQAVDRCAAGSGADIIVIPAGTYTLTIAGANEDDNATGDIDLKEEVTLRGAGPSDTIIDGGGVDRVFDSSAATAHFSQMTIRNGKESNGDGGGGILQPASVTNVVLDSNSTAGRGGAIFARGVTVKGSTLSGNTAQYGGGIACGTFDPNAIFSEQPFSCSLIDTTISNNSAEVGGGVFFTDGHTHGIGRMLIANSTITENIANGTSNFFCPGGTSQGGGLYTHDGRTSIANSIIAGNTDQNGNGPDCSTLDPAGCGGLALSASTSSLGYNLIGDTSECSLVPAIGDIFGTSSSPVDPLLAALVENSNGIFTHAPSSTSPVLDAGNPAVEGSEIAACTAQDASSTFRSRKSSIAGSCRCDIGAHELAPGAVDNSDCTFQVSSTKPSTRGCRVLKLRFNRSVDTSSDNLARVSVAGGVPARVRIRSGAASGKGTVLVRPRGRRSWKRRRVTVTVGGEFVSSNGVTPLDGNADGSVMDEYSKTFVIRRRCR